jgi:hypothetical protein
LSKEENNEVQEIFDVTLFLEHLFKKTVYWTTTRPEIFPQQEEKPDDEDLTMMLPQIRRILKYLLEKIETTDKIEFY